MGSADFRLIRPVGVTADGAFTRPSPKWVFDRTGTLVQVPAGSFAVSYDPGDLTRAPYAVAEAEATNLCPYSTNISAWTNNGSAWTSNFGMAPDGTISTTLVGSGTKYRSIGGLTVGADYTFSEFVRAGSSSTILIYADGMGSTARVAFDLSTQTFSGSVGSITATGCQYVGNGMYRIWMTFQPTGSTCSIHVYPSSGSAEFWGIQFEAGKVPTSYIGTSGSTATRSADDIASGAGLVYSNVPIIESNYSSTTAYAKDALAYDPSSRLVYQSLIDANTGKALTDTTAWTPQLATNRWRMFDKAVNSQTSAPDLLVVAIKPGQLVNAVGLLNVAGSSVTVTQTDSYYVQTKSLVRHDALNWYDFFYEEPIREGDVMFDGIPPYANSTLVITVTNQGDAAAIGCCVLGKSRTIGQTAWDLTGGILSYSSSATDKFGNVTMVKRDNSKVLNFEVYIPSGFESEAYRLLRECTDVELMIVGAEDYSMTYSYGYLGQWTVPVTNGAKTAHIEFKGLV